MGRRRRPLVMNGTIPGEPVPPMRAHCVHLEKLIVLSACMLVACSSSDTTEPPPTSGTLQFTVTTTGTDIDADGYSISVDGGAAQALPANGTFSWVGAGGAHTVALTGLAFNCDFTAPPTSATVTLGAVTPVAVQASCAPFLRNAIVYLSDAYGFAEVMVMRPDG